MRTLVEQTASEAEHDTALWQQQHPEETAHTE